jgi:hypothetical protein
MAGIRGTIYTISADGVLRVTDGSVVLAYVDPATGKVVTVEVRAGYQFDAKTGQVSPIPDYDVKTMNKEAKELGVGPNVPPTTFTYDQTLYFVSPTQGHNGNGNGQGQNQGGNGQGH